jgi:hypothetical protein
VNANRLQFRRGVVNLRTLPLLRTGAYSRRSLQDAFSRVLAVGGCIRGDSRRMPRRRIQRIELFVVDSV